MAVPPVLRAYQKSIIEDLRQAYRRGARAPLLVLPTGGGKTLVFAHAAAMATAKGRSVLILVHRRELLTQASDKLAAAGVPHGIIAPGHATTHDRVQVASVQTLARRLDQGIEAPQLVIIDEAHHAVAGQWRTILDQFPEAWLLGVTATPSRLDGTGLGVSAGGVFDALVAGPSVADLTADGFLVPARVFAPENPPDLRGIRTRAGDYDPTALTDLMSTAQVVEAVAAHYRLHVGDRPAVLFAASTRHADALAAGLRAAGIASEAISANTPAAEREAALSGLANGSVRILCSCDLISEGLDVPDIAAVILLRPTKSLALYLQQVGRGLRPAPGKHKLIVLDHAGNSNVHGLPDATRHWSLAGAGSCTNRRARKMASFCPRCASHVRRARPACRSCGAPLEQAEPPVSPPGVSLREVSGAADTGHDALLSRPVADLLDEARTIEDLTAIQRARGFKPGWVWHHWRSIEEGRQQRTAVSIRTPPRGVPT